jgi:AbrB family looped-hinge helix DNA binding protein
MDETDRKFIATITSNGRVTIPAEIRRYLRLSTHDKVTFRIVDGGKVEMEPLPMTLEDAYGSVAPIDRPEDFGALRRIVHEDRADRWLSTQSPAK